jgi:Mg2+/Co2+ transporter CorB
MKYITISLLLLIFLFSCKSRSPIEALERGRLKDLIEFHKKNYKFKKLINKSDTFLTYSIKTILR